MTADNDIVVSRKGIIAYLKLKIGLSDNMDIAWNKIRRWKKCYGMDEIIHHLPSGQCYMLKSEFQKWITKTAITRPGFQKGVSKGDDTLDSEKSQ